MSGTRTRRPRGAALTRALIALEKTRYPFRAWPRTRCTTLVFMGCALPAQLPRTTDALARLARKNGAGVAYDCCGRPLADWGMPRRSDRTTARLLRRLDALGCRRLVVACPTCLAHLRAELGRAVACVPVYDELAAWGLPARGAAPASAAGAGATGPAGKSAADPAGAEAARPCPPAPQFAPGSLFLPCPDRPSRAFERGLRDLMPPAASRAMPTVAAAPCCGLLASCAARGTAASQGYARAALKAADELSPGGTVYTYCASCVGQFARATARDAAAPRLRHALSALLGVDEEPDAAHALANRARRRFDRALEPLPAAPVTPSSCEEGPCSR